MSRLSLAASRRLADERQRLAGFRHDSAQRIVEWERNGDYCVCEVLFRNRVDELRVAVRGALVVLAGWLPASPMRVWLLRRLGVRIGPGVYIAPQVLLDPMYPELIELEEGCFLGFGCRIISHEYTASHFRLGRVRIGAGSVIGGWATVRSGVVVGRQATVGLNSLVTRDVADGLTVGGVPARPLPTGG